MSNRTDFGAFYEKPDNLPAATTNADMPPPEPAKAAYSDGVMIGVGVTIALAVVVIAALVWRERR